MVEKKQVYEMDVDSLAEDIGRVQHRFGVLMTAMHLYVKHDTRIVVTLPEDGANTGTVTTVLGTVTLELGYSHDVKDAVGIVKLSHALRGLHGMEQRPIGAFRIHPYGDSQDAEGDHLAGDSYGIFGATTGGQAIGSLMQAQMRAHVRDAAVYLDA